MDYRKVLGIVSLMTAGLLIFMGLATDHSSVETAVDSEKVNLAMRQVAHQLYSIAGDTESTIAPVEVLGGGRYTVTIDKKLSYDTLPYLVQAAMGSFELDERYYVSVKQCGSDTILLGFHDLALQQGQVACKGREIMAQCHTVELLIYEKKQTSNLPSLAFALLPLFLGIALLWRKEPQDAAATVYHEDAMQETAVLEPVVNAETILFGESQLMSTNQTVKVMEVEKKLTYRECKLLTYLVSMQNQVLTREDIQAHVWEDEGVIVGRSLDVFVSRLRKILKADQRVQIVNIHGVGYKLEVR